jgi:hypothetical protein
MIGESTEKMTRKIGLLFAVILTAICTTVSAAQIVDGDYYVVNKSSYKALTATKDKNGGIVLGQSDRRADDPGQVWTFVKIGKAGKPSFAIRSKQYGSYLAQGKANENGDTSVALNHEANATGRFWSFQPHLSSYGLGYGASGTTLNVTGSSESDDALIILYDASLHDNAQWLLYPANSRNPVASPSAKVSTFDNLNKHYQLAPTRPAAQEADRLRRSRLMDYQPSGVYLKKGESLSVTVRGLSSSPDGLTIMVGPMNSFEGGTPKDDPQLIVANEGRTDFVAKRSGAIYFLYSDSGFNGATLPILDVTITHGGNPFPLYIKGQTRFDEWRHILAAQPSAPFVEMMSTHVLITTTPKVYSQVPQGDPSEILNTLENIIGWYDELSGLDGLSELNQPSPLRVHYLQDTVSPSKVFDEIYMYASDYFVGSPAENMGDLLDVKKLRHAWSIWHETGHKYQQKDWTSDKTVETTVNIYSLVAEEHFGDPSRLEERDPDSGQSRLDSAARYLTQKSRDFDNDKQMQFTDEGGYSAVWVRLLMFDQLRKGLGHNFYPLLHKYYRAHPLYDSVIQDPAAQLQCFVLRSSIVSGRDLTKFFSDWGIPISRETAEQLRELKLPPADRNLAHSELP